ncbi:BTAD domain-containing putative transcriptional regulator [Pseudonocardia sp. WMMC193]|uniref:AfsR/SARP family transcriptional regulator n=1 Tax=Pseudonocardia sp. WMMC193 TaxID=2911965 RepID=UPI001F015988|nr:BTAD domain-containing putative transcriptional regulator [Pseudonocardia sp. WMMC193]MCF7551290.1 winged helix-turn-helix domain-containing protein [Pseudonocardia sp. WMMC193]
MRIGVLGPVAAWDPSGADVAPAGLRLRGLLARLALAPGRTVTAQTLVDDLWGDEPASANALQALVSRLRRALGPELVATVPGGYRLELPAAEIDAVRADRRLAEAEAEPDAETARELVGQALALWRGPALADVRRLPFAQAAADRLDEKRAAAVERAAGLDLRLGAPAAGIDPLSALLEEHPLRESAAAALARALHATGRQADALAVLDRTRSLLADELGVDPGPELGAARMDVLRGGSRPAPRPPSTVRAAAPAPLTSFVGRAADVARVRELLTTARLVTLVGPGGAGKTRLAREGAPGAAFAELAPLGGGEQIAPTVLAAVGSPELVLQQEPKQEDAVERLVAAIGRRALTLVLDNCEHLVEAAARLASTLLQRCPAVCILATSREPLGVPGERLHAVGALNPAAAAQLFLDRGAAVGRAPAADDPAIPEICRRLDGQPLPIELAAARLRMLTPSEILARLDDRFRLLTSGARTVLPRHQTLRAVVDWSWDLLEEPERTLARRLAVFAGGATAEAIDQVCEATGPSPDVFDTLAALVDKSLVVAVPGEPTRYRMLETIREYARERLRASGEEAATRARHAAWAVALVERAEPELRGRDQLRWLGVLRAEAGDITAALRRAVDTGDAPTAYRLVAGMYWAWLVRGATEESMAWVQAVGELPDADVPPDVLARVIAFRGVQALGRGRMADAFALAERATTLAADVSPPRHPVLDLTGPVTAAFEAHEEGLLREISTTHPDPWLRAFCLQIRATLAENEGLIELERELVRAAHALFTQVGDRFGLGMTLTTLGELEALAGNAAAAASAFEEAIALATELANDDDLPQFLVRRGGLAARSGDHALARKLYTEAVERIEVSEFGAPELLQVALAELDRFEGDLVSARARLADIDLVPGGLAIAQRTAHLFLQRGLVELAAGDPDRAAELLRAAVDAADESRDGPVVGAVAEAVAQLAAARGDVEGAARALGVAEARRGAVDLGDPAVVALLPGLDATLRREAACLPAQDGIALLRSACGTGTPRAGRTPA